MFDSIENLAKQNQKVIFEVVHSPKESKQAAYYLSRIESLLSRKRHNGREHGGLHACVFIIR